MSEEQDKAAAIVSMNAARFGSIGSRLVKAGNAIGTLAKDGRNAFHNYDYVTEAAVKREVGKSIRDAGLHVQSVTHEVLPGSTFTQVLCRTSVVIADDSGAVVVATGIGSGTDKGDKAAYKAMAGGLKYALTSLFLIATGDDPEEDERGTKPAPEVKPAAAKRAKASAEEPSPELVDNDTKLVDVKKSTAAALKWATMIAQSETEAALKTVGASLVKDQPNMTKPDFDLCKTAFKERMAQVKGS